MGNVFEPQCGQGCSRPPVGSDEGEAFLAAKYDTDVFPQQLGQGNFSKAYICWRRGNRSHKYALKVFVSANEGVEHAMNEIRVLQHLGSHPRIISLIDVDSEDPRNMRLVLELCAGGQLFDRLEAKGRYEEPEAAGIVMQILEALVYMHGKGVMHRDLKPENILMISATSEVDIKVCDFGIAKLADQVHIFSGSHLKPLQGSVTISTAPALPRSNSFKGSDFYLAPEMIRQEEYGSEVDLWALGVTSYCLLSASMPFVGEGGCDDLRGTYRKIVQRDFSFEKEAFDETSSEAKEFISRLLSLEPRQRPKATQAMLLSWITGFALKGLTSAQITEEDDDGDDEDDSDDHDPEDEEVDDEDANEPQGCIMHERLENKHDTCDF